MLKSLALVREWEGLVQDYKVLTTCSDHHDGLINAVLVELPDGMYNNYYTTASITALNCFIFMSYSGPNSLLASY
jgi:hypothetical protein